MLPQAVAHFRIHNYLSIIFSVIVIFFFDHLPHVFNAVDWMMGGHLACFKPS